MRGRPIPAHIGPVLITCMKLADGIIRKAHGAGKTMITGMAMATPMDTTRTRAGTMTMVMVTTMTINWTERQPKQ